MKQSLYLTGDLIILLFIWHKWAVQWDAAGQIVYYAAAAISCFSELAITYVLSLKWKVKLKTMSVSVTEHMSLCVPSVICLAGVVAHTVSLKYSILAVTLSVSLLLFYVSIGLYFHLVMIDEKIFEYTFCSDKRWIQRGEVYAWGGIKLYMSDGRKIELFMDEENLFICDNGDLLILCGDDWILQYNANPIVISKEDVKKIVVRRKGMPKEIFKYTNNWARQAGL